MSDRETIISHPHGVLDLVGGPVVMGILNVTPDSFSDGGWYDDFDSAVAHADRMIEEGAAIIDVGPESTRPGAEPVDADEQIKRACPVIQGIRRRHPRVAVSIDTRLSAVAEAAIEAGADIINDVSALRDDAAMGALAARSGAPVILMHMRGRPDTMQDKPRYDDDDVVADIIEFFHRRVEAAIAAGVRESAIILDPGIGFGKTTAHNMEILGRLDEMTVMGRPVLVGLSRKRFLGEIAGVVEASDRDGVSVAGALWCASKGAKIIRVHAVAPTVQSLRVWSALADGGFDIGGDGVGET